MKFLVDACAASKPLLSALTDLGCDVLSALDRFPSAPDEALLAFAVEEGCVLITEDKDFGEIVFLRGLPHPSIVRLVAMTPAERAQVMRHLIEHHADAMRDGAIIIVTRERIRIRQARNFGQKDD